MAETTEDRAGPEAEEGSAPTAPEVSDAPADEQEIPSEEVGPLVNEAAERIGRILATRGRRFAEVAARRGRQRLELFQRRRDLAKLYEKLGREVVRLVEAGEVSHPGLVKGAERITRQLGAVDSAREQLNQPLQGAEE